MSKTVALLMMVTLAACAGGQTDSAATSDSDGGEQPAPKVMQEPVLLLFTEEDAEQLRYQEDDPDWMVMPKGDDGDGPIIELVVPESFEGLRQPLPVHIQFEERLAPIDLATLEVRGKKGLFSRDVTDRVRPFFTEAGMQVAAACLATGRFKLEVKIKDDEGRESKAEYRVHIVDEDKEACEQLAVEASRRP